MKSRLTTTLAVTAACFFLTTSLAGCSQAEHSVDWYMKHRNVMSKTLKECGMLTKKVLDENPDCANALEAGMRLSGVSGS